MLEILKQNMEILDLNKKNNLNFNKIVLKNRTNLKLFQTKIPVPMISFRKKNHKHNHNKNQMIIIILIIRNREKKRKRKNKKFVRKHQIY